MKKCPYCSEQIQDTAKKCRFCGEWLERNSTEIQNNTPETESHQVAPAESQNRTTPPESRTSQTEPKPRKKKNGIIILVLAVFFIPMILFTVIPLLQTSNDDIQNSNSSLFTSDEDKFGVNFPGQPEVHELELDSKMNIKQYSYIDDHVSYFIKIGKFDSEGRELFKTKPAAVDVFLGNFPNNLFTPEDNNPSVISSEKKVFFSDYQGLEYEYKSETDGVIFRKKGLIFMRNGETLHLSMTYPEETRLEMEDKYIDFKHSLVVYP